MIMAGGRREVDSVLQVFGDIAVTHLIRDAEGARRRKRSIRVEGVAEPLRFQALLQLRGSVGADGDDGKAQGGEFRFDLAQLAELRVAVGSPTAAVENDEGAVLANHLSEVDRASL